VLCVRSAVFVGHVLLSLVVAMVLARLDYGSATLAGLTVFQICYLASFSLYSTLPHDWSSLVVSMTTLRHFSAICSGCRCRSTSRFVWLCLPTGANSLAPSYLSANLHGVTDAESRRRLRSTSTAALLVPRTRLSTVGDRAFPVAAARAWNNLPVSRQRPFCILS